MKKRTQLTHEQAGLEALKMLTQLRNNAWELHARASNNDSVMKLTKQLAEFTTNLLEWGTHEGNIEIWASFVPSMFDYEEVTNGD